MLRKPAEVLDAGLVRRWHSYIPLAHTAETDAEHQWMVVVLVLHLRPDASRALLLAAQFHDVGELHTGDLNLDFKKGHRDVADQHAEIEYRYRDAMVEWPALTADDEKVLKLADWFAAWVHMLRHKPNLRTTRRWRDGLRTVLVAAGEDDANRMVDLMTAYQQRVL